uniref:Uncharacterized protein n=1 Tax=Oryzias melastigma TaxID=30732 RepID=A0A3B3BIZ6_ORYME
MLCIILFKTNGAQITNSVLCPVGTNEEKKLGDEQVGPQVAVDRAVVMKMTGSVRYTLLDPLCTEAEMMCELTTRLLCLGSTLWPCPSPSLMVEFWVERKEPRFLYRESTNFTWPAEVTTEEKDVFSPLDFQFTERSKKPTDRSLLKRVQFIQSDPFSLSQ